MSDTEHLDREPDESTSTKPNISPKTRKSFSKLRRELSEDELSSPAVQRLLLEEVERLEGEARDLTHYRDDFYTVDKRVAVLEQKINKSVAGEIIFAVCLCVGAASLGYAPAVWQHQPSGYIAIVFGAILIICGVISRLIQR